MVVLKKSTNVGLAAFLVASTVITKLMLVKLPVYPAESHPYLGSHGPAVLSSNYKMLKSRRYCKGGMLKQTESQKPLSIMAATRKRVSQLGKHCCTLLSHPGNFHLGSIFPLDPRSTAPSPWQPLTLQGSRARGCLPQKTSSATRPIPLCHRQLH